MTATPYLVVGAGPTGLGCATALAAHGPVTVVERIPVAGGTAGWDDPDVIAFTRAARQAGVQLRLGQTALRWDGHSLLVAGPGSVEHMAGRHLFFAGGLRPATAANLCIDGDRPAGVVPATVAEHLLHARVRLWNTAVVIGGGPWARPVAHACRTLGTRVIAVADGGGDAVESADWADERHPEPSRMTVIGRDRVHSLLLHTPDGTVTVHCDAVILAAAPWPNRNVEGAVFNGSSGVTFLQPTRPSDPTGRHTAGRDAAHAWLDRLGDTR